MLLGYLVLFNSPVIVIVIYLFTHGHKEEKQEAVHFEKKPFS